LRYFPLIAVRKRKAEDGDAQASMQTTLLNRTPKRFALSVAILAAAFCASPSRITHAQSASAPAPASATLEMQSWRQNLKAWRTQHEMQVSAPDGWLTLAGLEWLKPGVNTIGSAADNGRFLHTGLPDHGLNEPGNLVLDFNQLENPPCAYTNFATCPLPPKQNQLETEIKAGEKRYER
jgi:uncharacterized protein (DUF1684 family)